MVAAATGLSTPATSFSLRWQRLPRLGRAILCFVAIALVYQFASSLVSGVTGSGASASGSSSSYDTTGSGTAALAQLLADDGFRVSRLTTPLSSQHSPGAATIFSLDPTSWSGAATNAVGRFLREGATVVVSGQRATTAVLRLVGDSNTVSWHHNSVGTAATVGSSRFTSGVITVNSPGPGSLTLSGTQTTAATVLAKSETGTLAVAFRHGGWLVVLASASAIQNSALATDDNAAFALRLANSGSRTVTFDEYTHGFGHGGSGLAGLPAPWRVGLVVIFLGIALWIVSASRRFGPPQRPERAFIPPRIDYVTALATLLETRPNNQLAATAVPVAHELRVVLARRLSLPDDADEATMNLAAERMPRGPVDYVPVVSLAFSTLASADDVVAVGRAIAALQRKTFELKEIHV